MGNCCISPNNQKQIARRPKDTNGKVSGKDKHSPVTCIAANKTATENEKKKHLVENGSSLHNESKFCSPAAVKSGNPPQDKDSSRSSQKSDVNEQNIETLFAKYKDKSEENILAAGTESLCQDLKLDPTEFRVLLLAWKCNVSQMCRFTRQEFTQGCRILGCDSIRTMQLKLSVVEQEVDDKELFRDLYRFTYGFGLDVEDGQRTLPTQVAIDLWKLVFTKKRPRFLDEWFEFLEKKQVKGISRDTWNMFLYLTETMKSDFSNYDDSEAWPSLFDEFVDERNQPVENEQNESDSAI